MNIAIQSPSPNSLLLRIINLILKNMSLACLLKFR